LTLLKKYSDIVQGLTYEESHERIEERKLHNWAVKFFMSAAASLAFLVAGGMLMLAYKTNELPDGEIFASIVESATEVLKLIFESK
jgi:hypothetical protein